MWVAVEENINIGQETFIDSINDSLGVIFEDNKETGYFYAISKESGMEVLDALHIYNVKDISEKEWSSILKIIWTYENSMAALIINDVCHAIFDFENEKGFNRNGYPKPKRWKQKDRFLTDEIEAHFTAK